MSKKIFCNRCGEELGVYDAIVPEDDLCADCSNSLAIYKIASEKDFVSNQKPGASLKKMLKDYENNSEG